MTVTTARRRPTVGARRFGYVLAVLINAAFLYVANVRPGWEAVPFLTRETALVMGLVNASVLVNLVANVVYLVRDPPRLKAFGDMVSAAFGLASLLRIMRVFPFDFGAGTFDWVLVVRVLLILGIVGCGIGVVAGFVRFVRGAPPSGRGARR